MQPPNPPDQPRWNEVRAACDELRRTMDTMIGHDNFESFRPHIARAIALARDQKQAADHPIPAPPALVAPWDEAGGEAIAIGLAPSDLARIILGAKA